jgi:hypothetical protein
MANTQNYYYAVQTHFFALDSSVVGGLTSPVFNRNFRVLDVECFVTTAAAGGTLTLNRIRGGAVLALCTLDVSALGRAVFTLDVSQTAALFESGDTLQLISNGAAAGFKGNVIVYLQQFSV